MSWNFTWGLVIGTSLGFLIAGLVMSEPNDQKHIETIDDEKGNEVEE